VNWIVIILPESQRVKEVSGFLAPPTLLLGKMFRQGKTFAVAERGLGIDHSMNGRSYCSGSEYSTQSSPTIFVRKLFIESAEEFSGGEFAADAQHQLITQIQPANHKRHLSLGLHGDAIHLSIKISVGPTLNFLQVPH
jgi:hypothetical protein